MAGYRRDYFRPQDDDLDYDLSAPDESVAVADEETPEPEPAPKFMPPPSREPDFGPEPTIEPPPDAPRGVSTQSVVDQAGKPSMPPPPPPEPKAPSSQDRPTATQRFAQLGPPPAAPKSNLAQKIAYGVLSASRLAPAAEAIVHPNYSAQRTAYERGVHDISTQLKAEDADENIRSNADYRKARGEEWKQKGKQLEMDAATRAEAGRDKRFMMDRAILQDGGSIIPRGAPAPPGTVLLDNPNDPSSQFAILQRSHTATPEMAGTSLGKAMGIKAGDQIDAPTYAKLIPVLGQETRQADKPVAAPKSTLPPTVRAGLLAIGAKDPNNPTPEEMQKQSDWQNKQAIARKTGRAPRDPYAGASVAGAANVVAALPSQPNVTGDNFLKTLPFALAMTVRGTADGRLTMPPANARNADAQALRRLVMQYDPEMSEQRAQIRKAFASGPDGRNVGALNTAAVHSGQLEDAAKAMANGSFVPGNRVYNAFKQTFGDSSVTNFDTIKAAVAGELAQALKGVATDKEIEHIAVNIQSVQSPEQMAGAVEKNLHILGAKLNTYNERFHKEIPSDKTWSPLLPSAEVVFRAHGFNPIVGGQQQRQQGQPDAMIRVQIPGQPPGQIHASQKDRFLQDHPGAKVL